MDAGKSSRELLRASDQFVSIASNCNCALLLTVPTTTSFERRGQQRKDGRLIDPCSRMQERTWCKRRAYYPGPGLSLEAATVHTCPIWVLHGGSMRIVAPLILLAIVLPPLVSRANDKPQPKLACSISLWESGTLSECLDLVTQPDDAALKASSAMCDHLIASLNGEEYQKAHPGTEGRTSTVETCDTSEYLTACAFPKDKAGWSLTTRVYVINKAFTDKPDCAKGKGKWIENADYKEYLHPPKVTAEQLHQEWRTNQAKAVQERGKKPMALSGRLQQVKVDSDGDDAVSVILAVNGIQRWVTVRGVSAEDAAKLKPNTNVSFDRCVLTGRTQVWDNPIATCE